MSAVTVSSSTEMRRYLLTVVAVLLVLYCMPFFIVRSTLYRRWNPAFYSRSLNYAYETQGQNADVVIFGDSTALLGVDPSQLSSALGVKAINLPNTLGTLSVNDDEVLRRYMQSNPPPRLIVFYFAPWDFDYGNTPLYPGMMYEGEEMLAMHGSARQIITFASKHRLDTLAFPLRLYLSIWKGAEPGVSYDYQNQKLRDTAGHIDNVDQTPLADGCRIPSLAIEHIRFAWVRGLGEKYRSPATKVFFYAAPVPSCVNVSLVVNRPYDQLPAAPPRQVPPSFFGNNAFYIHPRQTAVPALTQQLADALRPVIDLGKPEALRVGAKQISPSR